MSTFIRVEHPDIAGTAQVSEEYFNLDLEAKGWKRASAEPSGQPAKSASVDAWREYARNAGMPVARAEEMGRDEFVAVYTSPSPASEPAPAPDTAPSAPTTQEP